MQDAYADLEIRILVKRDEGYPVEMTLNYTPIFASHGRQRDSAGRAPLWSVPR